MYGASDGLSMKRRVSRGKTAPSRRGASGSRQSSSRQTGSRHARALGTLEGAVSAHRSGFGFVKVEGQTDSVFLPPPQMGGLTSGDRVRVRVKQGADGRLSGEVE
ncbi:MAG: Ribonuclease domain, partial [Pseudomonadota bacterium]